MIKQTFHRPGPTDTVSSEAAWLLGRPTEMLVQGLRISAKPLMFHDYLGIIVCLETTLKSISKVKLERENGLIYQERHDVIRNVFG